ncbi:IS3 family transposase [Corynebacterium sp. YIM 101645]|uniref:IS3 family transposase n=1 Tax=Corynebacterium lemuris TaxID=1859292 RepID=A0ABT2FTR3_9CORY|nr:IS3 family transposase [Corynebacterium lemuris]
MSKTRTLQLIGLSRSAYHYRHHPRRGTTHPIPQRDRYQPHALTVEEIRAVGEVITTGFTHGRSIEQSYFQHLDAHTYLASLSTFYRVARRRGLSLPPARRRRRHATTAQRRAAPMLKATAPDQVYCWDISFLPGATTRQSFALYTVIDLYSRKIVGHTVQPTENHYTAATFLAGVIDQATNQVQVVHSDNGAAMTSASVHHALTHRGVEMSFIWPGVSNDNAFVESFFKTLKHGHHYPGVFDDIDEAAAWITDQISYYNTTHRHSGIAGFTPQQLHDGSWVHTARRRQQQLTAAYHRTPGRFRRPPLVETPKATVSINIANDGSKLQLPPVLETLLAS